MWLNLGFCCFFRFYQIDWFLIGWAKSYWVLLGFTGFYWVLLGFTRLYRVIPLLQTGNWWVPSEWLTGAEFESDFWLSVAGGEVLGRWETTGRRRCRFAICGWRDDPPIIFRIRPPESGAASGSDLPPIRHSAVAESLTQFFSVYEIVSPSVSWFESFWMTDMAGLFVWVLWRT